MEDDVKRKRSEARLQRAAHRVVQPLERLVEQMAVMEEGAVVDDATFTLREKGMSVAYRARPIAIAFINGTKKISVRVEPIVVSREKSPSTE